MGKCHATTKKGAPCKRAAMKGSRFCSTHASRPKNLPRARLLADLMDFANKATDDLLTLDVMKAQYCSDDVRKEIKKEMNEKEVVLRRILHGHDRHPKTPGLIQLLNRPDKISSDELISMRRKFVALFRQLTGLIVKHCKVKALSFTLPELKIELKFSKKDTGCNDVPEALQEWLDDDDEATGRDKQVLCLAVQKGERVKLSVGFLLPDDFVVMHNVDDGKWYGVARRAQENWSQRILELLKYKVKGALVALVRGLWNTILTTTVPILALVTWQRLLVIILTANLTHNKWLLHLLPGKIVDVCRRLLRSIFSLMADFLRHRPIEPAPSTAVALWLGLNVVSETCPFIPQRLLPLPPRCNFPMIAPPPPALACPLMPHARRPGTSDLMEYVRNITTAWLNPLGVAVVGIVAIVVGQRWDELVNGGICDVIDILKEFA